MSLLRLKAVTGGKSIFCDPVHGQISFHPVCVAIIDTPEFQRLRNIKQTGLLDYVFPGATHSRFSHSLGVCHLAGLFVRKLLEYRPELSVTEVDILCIEIAGLCHDLGHGPLSHSWENFMQEKRNLGKDKRIWKHEMVSLNVFDYLLQKNDLLPLLEENGISSAELNNVKLMIMGCKPENKQKTFLYQIVNNDDSGLDVDKWDYFLRDCHYMGLPCNFDYQRLIQFAKVLSVNGNNEICYRDKVCESVYNVFRTRSNLHRDAYQHRVVSVLETMFADAVLKADEIATSPSGEILRFWEWSMGAAFGQGNELHNAIEKYITLTDDLVFSSLKHNANPLLEKATTLITAIEKRSCKCGFYQHVALKICHVSIDCQMMLKEMAKILPNANEEIRDSELGKRMEMDDLSEFLPVTIDDLVVKVLSINWGKKEKDPVQFVHFYNKNQPFQVHTINLNESSVNLPKAFEELQLHVICRRSDPYALEVSKLCFKAYWQRFSNTATTSHL